MVTSLHRTPIFELGKVCGCCLVIFSIGCLYSIDAWLGEDYKTKTMKIHILKRIGVCLQISLSYSKLISVHNGTTYVFNVGNNKHALLITINK